ncbi:MAG: hypothetical protein EXS51_00765 [Candidatus Taylorbacteria bacterium]|nr:hypothetical protein [Candidatus Taylorbacteria bacterium]
MDKNPPYPEERGGLGKPFYFFYLLLTLLLLVCLGSIGGDENGLTGGFGSYLFLPVFLPWALMTLPNLKNKTFRKILFFGLISLALLVLISGVLYSVGAR